MDDIIIVSGGGIKTHKEKVFKCLQKLDKENLSINLEKCHFAKNKIEWLGFEINQNGIKPLISKTEAIQNQKAPNTCKQLKSFLGSVHHLIKFVPNLAIQCIVFRDLLKKDNKYKWDHKHQIAFENLKLHIKNITENTHYDSTRKTSVRTDASRSRLGAVLEQESNKGWETIAYASRFLNKAEEKYSINELELLGVVWALEHFKHYLYGHYFTVQTDHRALLSILKEKSTKAHQSRQTRWCERLIPFHFQIKNTRIKDVINRCDSRNPNNKAKPIIRYDEDFVIAQIEAIKQTIYAIKQRGRPRKPDKLESSNDSKALITKPEIKRQRGRPRKLPLQSKDDSKIKVPRAQSHKTKPQTLQKLHNYSLRRNKELPNIENHVTIDDATLQKVTQQNSANACLPNNLATDKSLPNSNSNFEMVKKQPTIQQTPPTSPAKNPISFSTYLSPDKEDRLTKVDT